MGTRQGRFDRVARLLPYYLAGALLGAGGLYVEYRLLGTVLLVPAFHWTSRSIPGAVLTSTTGDYSVSFKHTRLDWRFIARGTGVVGPALTAGTRSGWRLHVWETAAGAGGAPWGTEVAPGLRRAADGVVRGAFRAGSKDVTLEFVPPAGDASLDAVTLSDMLELSRSVKPSELKSGSGD